jgi:hypothetical protein
LEQLFLFLTPVLLLFCEWWLVDRIVEAFPPRRRDRENGS